MIIGFILLAICLLRVPSALISARNEKRIKASGGTEYGTTNSKLLIIVQGFIYLSCIVFAFINDVQFNVLTIVGLIVYAFSMASLVYVIRTLGPFWTFKLYIAKDHQLVQSPLFKHIRHPNYYMNIIPELIAFALISQAWIVFTPLFVLHLLTLFNRIALEEKVMKETFRQY
ncbi:isoprenylcysteine carboxylmethyltransferase family protein [Paenibacillus ehimensis]|uniref:Isoprenylcysteine carboxylmethyltransferase family protein n=1 Tax=Paenibacillus ehimensis TaxID=79264 RepID=A0ABT8V4B8_9BACL|nr:isoprenylcysteine carboxylmethyltransferase family protein [Paenibacillus ehimensis]MDO3676286.1 isoprenylcysteine carboxylmethyltransferase family protein [Paenibacillus ehimensis]MEC0210947.1 isoprenylcysteine carboxylmethyltransferase family protein [Paenibacillus ehimensis]